MKFSIVVNINREEAIELARQLMAWLDERNLDYVVDAISAEKLGVGSSAEIEKLNKLCDVFISLGGDGTLLFTSHYSVTKPVIGINVGHLGFLAEFSKEEMYGAIEKCLQEHTPFTTALNSKHMFPLITKQSTSPRLTTL